MSFDRGVDATHRHAWATPTSSGVWDRLTVEVKILADRRPDAGRSGARSGEAGGLKGLGHINLCETSSGIALASESPGLTRSHQPSDFEFRGGGEPDLSCRWGGFWPGVSCSQGYIFLFTPGGPDP